jgi:hypothetical protein
MITLRLFLLMLGVAVTVSSAGAAQSSELPESPQTYVDLAKTDVDSGNIVGAALNYQRALVLDPGYRVAQNAFAEFAAANRIQLRPRSWQDDVVAFVHPETLTMIGCAVGWIGALGLAWMVFAGGFTVWRTAGGIALVGVGTALFAMGWVSDPRIADANLAVLSGKDPARVLSGPADNSAMIAELSPGSAVGILSPRGPWTYVVTPSGARGWIASDRLISVLPESQNAGEG